MALVEDEESGEEPAPDARVAGGARAFVSWLRATSRVKHSGLPRYLQAIYDERPDLQEAFPEVIHGETAGFADWLRDWGRMEYSSIRLLGHSLPPPSMPCIRPREARGVDVIGFLHAEHGIGEAARLLIDALRSVDVPVSTLSYRNSKSRQEYPFDSDDLGRYRTVIAAVNAELNEHLRPRFGSDFFEDTYVIGQWFWELEQAPSWYRQAYKYVDELWAPTEFIADMLRRDAPARVSVHHIPLPMRLPHAVKSVSHSDFGLREAFTFLFTFDFMSVMKRKNPLGVVEAFKNAFKQDEGPLLVLKSINADSRPHQSAMLRAAIADRTDIVWIDRYFGADESAGLMNLCDCYVSLHRSEGLGLTIAEAMLLGKPVIATGYSGNMDFMSPETSYVVPWKYARVGDGAEAYDRRGRWAEPDHNVAVEMMRFVFHNPEEAARVGSLARRDLSDRFTLERAGTRMRQRLSAVWSMGGSD